MSRSTILVITAVLLTGIILGVSLLGRDGTPQLNAAPVPKAKATERFRFVAFEDFDGKFGLNWKPIRHDPTHISLTKNRGKLTITTQRGTLHANASAQGEPDAQNLFLLDNPLAAETDLVMTTCISSFTPTAANQSAGLLCYDDDDNYVRWSYAFDWSKGEGGRFMFVRETERQAGRFSGRGGAGVEEAVDAANEARQELRVFDQHRRQAVRDPRHEGVGRWAPKKLGLVAKNGPRDGVLEIDACFDFFELRSIGTE